MITIFPTRAARRVKTALDSVPTDFDATTLPILDSEDVEALAFGYGVPPEPVLSDVRRLWWRLRRQAVPLPVEGRVVLIEAGAP